MSQPEAADNLIVATDRQPAPVERRKSNRRRVTKERRKTTGLSTGLEISPAGVSLAIAQVSNEGEDTAPIKTDFIAFGCDSGEFEGDWFEEELTQSLRQLAEKYRLSGQAVSVALGGEPCVTRAWFGDNEEVDENIKELTERTNRYLALGRGEKVCCYAEKQIDAKRKRAWVTVARRDVVDAVSAAVEAAGMRLSRMEHTLPTLCEAIGQSKQDADEPVLILTKGRGRPELGISFQGQMILDYRPPSTGQDESGDVGVQAVQKHVKCLRRFAFMQLPRGSNEIQRICMPGRRALAPSTAKMLQEQHQLQPVAMPIQSLAEDVDESNEIESSEMLAAVWLAKNGSRREGKPAAADLMLSLRPVIKLSAGLFAKTFWPIAAALLLIVGLHVYAGFRSADLARAEEQLESLQPSRIEAERIRMELAQNREAGEHIDALKAAIEPVSWNEVLKFAGRALPQGTWLKALSVDPGNTVVISGASFTDDAIYDYVNRLRESKMFLHVTLGATKTVRLRSGPAYEFEISTTAVIQPTPRNAETVATLVGPVLTAK